MKSPIYPCFWFNRNAKEAADFYLDVFPESKAVSSNELVSIFESAGQRFMCLNGGPGFSINPSISMYTVLRSEELIQKVWDQLMDGGSALMPLDSYPWSKKYGWVKDKYGVSWQLTIDQPEASQQLFSPCLMFTGDNFGKAEEAIGFYTSLIQNSKLVFAAKYGPEHGVQEGKVMHAQFLLNNGLFVAMDSSYDHGFNFNEGVSFVIECSSQEEIDHYWEGLLVGGVESQCGWLKDQYGVSWQIVPAALGGLIADPVNGPRVMENLLKMKKIRIKDL